MKKRMLTWAFALCSATAIGQRCLVPRAPLFDEFKLSRLDALEIEYLMGGNAKGMIGRGAFGGGEALTYNSAENILFYSKHDRYHPHQLLNDTLMDVVHPEALHRYKMLVPDSVITIIDQTINAAVKTSSYLYEDTGHDGADFYFNPLYHTAYCWSPGDRCGELLDVLLECGNGVASGCLDSVLMQMPRCRELLRSFRGDYPVINNSFSPRIYIRYERGQDGRADHKYSGDYEQLLQVAHKLFVESDCMLKHHSISVKDNGHDDYLLCVDGGGDNTLYLDSLHITPEQIYEVARHIGLFAPGYYRYLPEAESFEWVKPWTETPDTWQEYNYFDEETAEDPVVFPLLRVINDDLYRTLAKSKAILDKQASPDDKLVLELTDNSLCFMKCPKYPMFPIGYFEWNGENVYVTELWGDTDYSTILEKSTEDNPICVTEKDCDFYDQDESLPGCAFVIDQGILKTCIGEADRYREAVNRILEQKGLTLDEVYVSLTLMPIPAEYIRTFQHEHNPFFEQYSEDRLGYRPNYVSPFSNLDSLIEKASLKLSVIDDGYFVVRYTDQQGSTEYYCFQVEEDCSLTSLSGN